MMCPQLLRRSHINALNAGPDNVSNATADASTTAACVGNNSFTLETCSQRMRDSNGGFPSAPRAPACTAPNT